MQRQNDPAPKLDRLEFLAGTPAAGEAPDERLVEMLLDRVDDSDRPHPEGSGR